MTNSQSSSATFATSYWTRLYTSEAPTMIESLTQVQILSTNTFVRLKGQLQDVDNNVYEICIFNYGLYIYIITNWTCNCTLYNTIVLVVAFGTLVAQRSATRTRFRTLVAGRSATRMLDGIRRNKQFWSNLNCKFEFFFGGKTYCRGGSRLNRPYKQVLQGRLAL